jgi:hypothetical protein
LRFISLNNYFEVRARLFTRLAAVVKPERPAAAAESQGAVQNRRPMPLPPRNRIVSAKLSSAGDSIKPGSRNVAGGLAVFVEANALDNCLFNIGVVFAQRALLKSFFVSDLARNNWVRFALLRQARSFDRTSPRPPSDRLRLTTDQTMFVGYLPVLQQEPRYPPDRASTAKKTVAAARSRLTTARRKYR